jgi:hypothetical protein
MTEQSEAAVSQALVADYWTAFAEYFEAQAQWAEDDEPDGSPYLALATHLRALAARLVEPPPEGQLNQ